MNEKDKPTGDELKDIYQDLEVPGIIKPLPPYMQTAYVYIEGDLQNEVLINLN